MKTLLLPILLLIASGLAAQNNYIGFASSKYYAVDKGGTKQVSGSISIVYNRYYCSIFIEGRGTISFPVDSYVLGDDASESFISDDNGTSLRGRYDVLVQRNKSGNSVSINIPDVGFAYIIENAHAYSANGEVLGKIDIKAEKYQEHRSTPHSNERRTVTIDSLITASFEADRARKSDSLAADRVIADARLTETRRINDSLAIQAANKSARHLSP
jgi:hypothetical protein